MNKPRVHKATNDQLITDQKNKEAYFPVFCKLCRIGRRGI